MKIVIYKQNNIYYCTNEQNYNATIQNKRQIQELKDFENAKEIIEYYTKYFNYNENDFIIV